MISKNTIKYVASLARISLEDREIENLTKDLGQILDYVKKLEKLDVSQVSATSHVLPINNVFRRDQVKPSLTQKEALNFAVSHYNGFFKVPKVIE